MKSLLRISTKQLQEKSPVEVTRFVESFYKNRIQGKKVINLDTGLEIEFNRKSRKKTAESFMPIETASAVIHLIFLLKNASFNNWGKAEKRHLEKFKSARGFMNFKCAVLVDGKKMTFRISVIVCAKNKIQYNFHEDSLEYAVRKGKKRAGKSQPPSQIRP